MIRHASPDVSGADDAGTTAERNIPAESIPMRNGSDVDEGIVTMPVFRGKIGLACLLACLLIGTKLDAHSAASETRRRLLGGQWWCSWRKQQQEQRRLAARAAAAAAAARPRHELEQLNAPIQAHRLV